MTDRAVHARTLVVIPTYNERESLPPLLGELLAWYEGLHVLVVDDGSPDGTGGLVQRWMQTYPRLHLLQREAKLGLGSAYKAGFAWGLQHGFDVLCEMDADGSHRPDQLLRLLDRLQDGADLVLGSRYVPGGATVGWSQMRRLVSSTANALCRLVLGTEIRDATAGFRVYRAEALRRIEPDSIRADGYAFQVEMLMRMVAAGLVVMEVPITFRDRAWGRSKMSPREVLHGALALWRLRRLAASRPAHVMTGAVP